GRNAPHVRPVRPSLQRLSCPTPLLRLLFSQRPGNEALFSPLQMSRPYKVHSKIGLNNTIKIRFICNSECFLEDAIVIKVVTFDSPHAASRFNRKPTLFDGLLLRAYP